MSEAKGFDVKIVYVCVLNATESRDTLHDLISNGGWNCLSKWLESFILTERHAAIRELLKCFQKLPITHRTLSTQVESKDLPGKMIRGLRKHADEEIKSLTGSIYKSINCPYIYNRKTFTLLASMQNVSKVAKNSKFAFERRKSH